VLGKGVRAGSGQEAPGHEAATASLAPARTKPS
jgi:hypothetical protein